MTEERFEQFLKRTLDELDPIPQAPREEIWARIERERRAAQQSPPARGIYKPWLAWGAGLAAMLALGIGIGRISTSMRQANAPQPVPVATAPAPVNRTAYRLTVAEHLTSAEALLTSFRTQPKGALDPDIAGWARDLLTNTRLLLDSPAADDASVAALLGDLELIIAQIVRMSPPSTEEAAIIREGMNKTAVLPRLRATMPAGPAAAGT